MTQNRILIGKIIGAWGIKGGIKIQCFTDNPRDLQDFTNIFDQNGKPYKIRLVKTDKAFAIALIDGIKSRNDAEPLEGNELFILRSDLPTTKDNEFYYSDLVGMEVRSEINGLVIGVVRGVMNFGASDILEIEEQGGIEERDGIDTCKKNSNKSEPNETTGVPRKGRKPTQKQKKTFFHPFSNEFVPNVNLLGRYLTIIRDEDE